MASANGMGESRRHQALPAVLATVVGALTSGQVLEPVVWCSARWSGARHGGLVLGTTVVWCSARWSGARTGGRVLGTVVWCSDRWSGAPVVAAPWRRRRRERGMRARLWLLGNLERSTASKGLGMVTVNMSVLC